VSCVPGHGHAHKRHGHAIGAAYVCTQTTAAVGRILLSPTPGALAGCTLCVTLQPASPQQKKPFPLTQARCVAGRSEPGQVKGTAATSSPAAAAHVTGLQGQHSRLLPLASHVTGLQDACWRCRQPQQHKQATAAPSATGHQGIKTLLHSHQWLFSLLALHDAPLCPLASRPCAQLTASRLPNRVMSEGSTGDLTPPAPPGCCCCCWKVESANGHLPSLACCCCC
jgi:hypothetical protein